MNFELVSHFIIDSKIIIQLLQMFHLQTFVCSQNHRKLLTIRLALSKIRFTRLEINSSMDVKGCAPVWRRDSLIVCLGKCNT